MSRSGAAVARRAFIFVTHDQEEAMAMSDRIVVFHRGSIAQVGTPEEIYQQPASQFVAEFVGETNILAARRDDRHVFVDDLGITEPAPSNLSTPGSFLLSLRPENVELVPNDRESGIPATVSEIEYGGMTVRFSAAVQARKAPIRVAVQAEHAHGLAIGSSVRLRFNLAAAAVVPAE